MLALLKEYELRSDSTYFGPTNQPSSQCSLSSSPSKQLACLECIPRWHSSRPPSARDPSLRSSSSESALRQLKPQSFRSLCRLPCMRTSIVRSGTDSAGRLRERRSSIDSLRLRRTARGLGPHWLLRTWTQNSIRIKDYTTSSTLLVVFVIASKRATSRFARSLARSVVARGASFPS